MSSLDYDVMIVGAGIAGSALARSLSGKGLTLALVEGSPISTQLPEPLADVTAFDARVSAITPASQALFAGIGVWEDIVAAGACPYQAMHVWDAEGTGAIDFSAAELDAPRLGTIVENRAITAALQNGLDCEPDVTLFNPVTVDGMHRNDDNRPCLELSDGRSISASLLVAADGALSRIREMAGFRTREWDYGHHAIVTTVEMERPHSGCAYQRFLQSGPLALLPLESREDRYFCSIVWSALPELAEELLAFDDKQFCAALTEASEARLGEIRGASPRFSFPLRQRHAIDYVQQGIALIGDAAHTIHPLAGQGINLGLQDVAALSEELLAGWSRQTAPGELLLLKRYQRRRKSENLLMMSAMDGFKRLFGEGALPLRWLRNTGMRLVDRAGPVKQQLMRHAMGIR